MSAESVARTSDVASLAIPGSFLSLTPPQSKLGDPTWEVALLFPTQGRWTDDDFFALENRTRYPMELVDGCIRMLPMPTEDHQAILSFLNDLFKAFVLARNLGRVRFAPLPIRFSPKHIREPDLMFLSKDRPRSSKGYPEGAELVLEIVSESAADRKRDFEEKRSAYAAMGVREYWIVDPLDQLILVLTLDGDCYREHGVFKPGEQATSAILSGLLVPVSDVFAAVNS